MSHNPFLSDQKNRSEYNPFASDIEKLKKTSDTIKKSLIVADQTEVMGVTILENLDKNNQKIRKTQDTVIEINGGISSANKNSNVMKRHTMTNKVILCCVIITILLGIGVLAYLKFHVDRRANSNTTPSTFPMTDMTASNIPTITAIT